MNSVITIKLHRIYLKLQTLIFLLHPIYSLQTNKIYTIRVNEMIRERCSVFIVTHYS